MSAPAPSAQPVEPLAFNVHFQPLICARTRRCIGAETLLRCTDANGPVAPADALRHYRTIGAGSRLFDNILAATCKARAAWRVPSRFLSSLNVQPSDLTGELITVLRRALSKHQWQPRSFAIEITETAPLNHANTAVLNELAASGYAIWLDDYGSGHSNLHRLVDHPVDGIKLDHKLISRLSEPRIRTIVRATAQLGRALGATVIGEGVESASTATTLGGLGVAVYQGHHFSPAVPGVRFMRVAQGQP